VVLTPIGNVIVVVAIGDRAAYRQQQDLRQRIGDAMRRAVVRDDRKAIEQQAQARAFAEVGW
jgi:hypothetical protein